MEVPFYMNLKINYKKEWVKFQYVNILIEGTPMLTGFFVRHYHKYFILLRKFLFSPRFRRHTPQIARNL